MGELIKKYGEINIEGMKLDVELNEPIDPLKGGIVHLQNSFMRLEMTQLDFYRFVGCVNLAKTNLLRIKGAKR